jgi:hypothetical protein
VNLPNATAIGDRALYSCTNLESFNAPNVASIGTYAFYECRNLKSLRFPKLTAIPANAFYRATSLTMADFASVTSIGGQAFAQCTSLKVLALRNPDAVVTIQSNSLTSSFGQTLVPSALLSQYKSATNWSARATSIKALEDYTVDGTITGELDETKIVW